MLCGCCAAEGVELLMPTESMCPVIQNKAALALVEGCPWKVAPPSAELKADLARIGSVADFKACKMGAWKH